MASAKGVPASRRWRTRSSMARRLSRPVSGSVSACSCDLAIARSTPRRVPTWAATTLQPVGHGGGPAASLPTGAVAWMTAVGVPRIVIGTHTAEHGSPPRSDRRGHAERSSLLSK